MFVIGNSLNWNKSLISKVKSKYLYIPLHYFTFFDRTDIDLPFPDTNPFGSRNAHEPQPIPGRRWPLAQKHEVRHSISVRAVSWPRQWKLLSVTAR